MARGKWGKNESDIVQRGEFVIPTEPVTRTGKFPLLGVVGAALATLGVVAVARPDALRGVGLGALVPAGYPMAIGGLAGVGVEIAMRPRTGAETGDSGKVAALVSRAEAIQQTPGALNARESFVRTFGEATPAEYPAPYRLKDALEMASVALSAASERAPYRDHVYASLERRLSLIHAAEMPPWRKTYAIVAGVMLPVFGSNILWHWYRPRTRVKQDRFAAMAAWTIMFFNLPVTATVSPTVDPSAPASSLPGYTTPGVLPHFEARLTDPTTPLLRGGLTPLEMRRAMLDALAYVATWERVVGGADVDPDSMIADLENAYRARIEDLMHVYPMNDLTEFVLEGNLKIIDEFVWVATASVEQSIYFDYDTASAIAGLVVQVVAVVVSAVAPLVSPALAAAIQAGANAISAVARTAAAGGISTAQLQALGGAGVAFMLDQAAIRLDLESEKDQIEELLSDSGLL